MSQSGSYGAGGGGGSGELKTLSDGTTLVNPSTGGNIALVQGADTNIVTTSNPGAHSINFQLSDSIVVADNITSTAGSLYLAYSNYETSVGMIFFSDEPSIYTDANENVYFYNFLGSSPGGGSGNTGMGSYGVSYDDSFTGSYNSSFGYGSLYELESGSYNLALGYYAGYGYFGAESSNIVIGNYGVTGESNVIRIGQQGTDAGEQNLCYIAGIQGVTPTNGPVQTVIIGTDGQLGSTTGGGGVSVVPFTSVTTSPYTVLSTDYFLGVTVSSIPITILLPDAPTTGTVYIIKDSMGNAGTNNITLTTVSGSVFIDNLTTVTMNINYSALNVLFDGGGYEIF